MRFSWDPDKSAWLKRERGVSFEEITLAQLVAVLGHPKRPNQRHLLFEIDRPEPCLYEEVGERGVQMKRGMKLTRSEQAIERAIARGEYRPASQEDFNRIADALARHRKDAVLNIRINSRDLEAIKRKAKAMDIPYQTFISEIIHRYAS